MYKDLLNQIANVLYINLQHMEENGLLKGKLGIAVFFYKYSRYTGNMMYANFADEILDYVLDGLKKKSVMNFAEGLSGIAWGIDYLMKNNFVDVDKDILNDIDQIVKEINIIDFSKELEYTLPLFSKGLYFIQRDNRHEIRKTVFELNSFVEVNDTLPDVYNESVLYFLCKAIDLNIEKDCCILMKQKLSNGRIDSNVTDVVSFYNHCWRYFLYTTSSEYILKSLPAKYQLELFTDKVIDKLNSQSFSIYQGLAGLGFVLMYLDQ